MEAYIYLITCSVSGKRYVGSTTMTVKNRFAIHVRDSVRSKRKDGGLLPMYKDMNQYGIEAFEVELLETVPKGTHKEREQYWMNELDTCANGYNTRWSITKQPFKDYHREWHSKVVVCSCGKDVKWGYKTKHERTAVHLRELLKRQEEVASPV